MSLTLKNQVAIAYGQPILTLMPGQMFLDGKKLRPNSKTRIPLGKTLAISIDVDVRIDRMNSRIFRAGDIYF
jgi:hypothetical protein